jgi:hypothetical protein
MLTDICESIARDPGRFALVLVPIVLTLWGLWDRYREHTL